MNIIQQNSLINCFLPISAPTHHKKNAKTCVIFLVLEILARNTLHQQTLFTIQEYPIILFLRKRFWYLSSIPK